MSDKRKNIRSGAKLPSGAYKFAIFSLFMVLELFLYMLSLKLESISLYVSLYIICALLVIIAFALSGGGLKKIPEKRELNDSLDDEAKEKLIAFLVRGKKINNYLMLAILPLVFILGFDIIKVMFF